MINVLLTSGMKMPKNLFFPKKSGEALLKDRLTDYTGKCSIDCISSGLPWLDTYLQQLVLTKGQHEFRAVQQLNLLAFVMERMPEQSLSDMKVNLREGLTMEDLINRAYYFADFADMSHVITVEHFHKYDLGNECGLLREEENRKYPIPRMTGGELFSKILQLVEDAGDLQNIMPILDYAEPTADLGEITNYKFALLPKLWFGSDEGIYIDCNLHGSFDNTDNQLMNIGTIRTLRSDLEACKLMGELCGPLLYHGDAFVNSHLNLFTPEKEFKRAASRKGEKALCQSIELHDKVDACVEEALREAVRQQIPTVTIPFSQFSKVLGWDLTSDNETALKALKEKLMKRGEIKQVEIQEEAYLLTVDVERLMQNLLVWWTGR